MLRRLAFALVLVSLLVTAACDQGGTPTATVPAPTATTQAVEATATQAVEPSPTAMVGGADPTAASAEATPATGDTFQNPVLRSDFADPFVLKEGDTYYAYATNATGKNIQVARSSDLVKWELLRDAMPALPTWARPGGSLVWAPETIKIGDKFLLYYTARDKKSNKQCVGVAVSDKPEGKYLDTRAEPLVCQAQEGGTIDASPFLDGDKLYLYYKNDGNCCGLATYLYGQEMAPDGLSLTGEPVRLVRNDTAWEGRVTEAPTMWKHEDKYYLFFSGNNYAGFEYAVGYADCQTAMGPCVDSPDNPILASQMGQKPPIIGPGHQTIIVDDDGETWMVYHVWDVTSAGLRGSSRFMWIDKIEWKEGKPDVLGPTREPQPRP